MENSIFTAHFRSIMSTKFDNIYLCQKKIPARKCARKQLVASGLFPRRACGVETFFFLSQNKQKIAPTTLRKHQELKLQTNQRKTTTSSGVRISQLIKLDCVRSHHIASPRIESFCFVLFCFAGLDSWTIGRGGYCCNSSDICVSSRHCATGRTSPLIGPIFCPTQAQKL